MTSPAPDDAAAATVGELRAELAEHRRLLERSPAAVAVLDQHGVIERCNPAFVDLLGGGPDRLLGQHLLDLVDELDRDRAREELDRVLLGRRELVRTELRLRGVGGRRFPAAVSVGQLGGPRRTLQVVARDLTDRVRDERERTRLTEQLARAHRLETVGQLAGGLAHDLNNLLTVLVTSLGLAEESLAEVEQAAGPAAADALAALAEDLGHVRAASDRVGVLTRELLRFAARGVGRPSRVRVADVLASLGPLLDRSVGGDVELRTDVADDVPDVRVDPGRYEQALTNLVLNARDAMPAGGCITVTARRHEDARGAAAVVAVCDEGDGMSDEVLARAFEPLFTTKSPDRGTGLGLPSVLAFAEEADGDVRIDTAPGRGTRVELRVPAADALAPDADAHAPLALIVDPSELTRQVVASMLLAAGYRTQVVASASEARTVLAEGEVSVVLVDAVLPDGSGSELAVLAQEQRPRPAVVLLASAELRERAGGLPVLTKPFSSERLTTAVTAARIAAGQLPDRRA